MVAKKHTKKANPKRRSGGRKNPFMIDGKKYYTDKEIEKISTAAKAILKASEVKKPSAPKLSNYSNEDISIISLVTSSGFRPAMLKGVPLAKAQRIIKKLDHDEPLVSGEVKKAIQRSQDKLAEFTNLSEKQKPAKEPSLMGIVKSKLKSQEDSLLKSITKGLASRSGKALSKKKVIDKKSIKKAPSIKLDRDSLLEIARELKQGNPSGGMKMAAAKKRKSKAKKAPARKKKAGKKVAARKAKAAPRKKRRKPRTVGLTAASKKSLGKKVKSARKSLRRKSKGAKSRKYKAKIQFKKLRNPTLAEGAMSIAKIAAAGAAAGVALQLANKLVKPMIDKVVPKMIADLKVGNAPVGQIALSCLIPGLLAYGLRMVKHPMAQQVSDVIIVTTAANAGQRLVAGLLPGGMAGVEPMLMGVEPLLMGDADFGDADFGDADFGAIEQFSGVEPLLMGQSADFGAIEQFSGHDAASLGAIQMHGYGHDDEDYAGEDDMDGESEFGLG